MLGRKWQCDTGKASEFPVTMTRDPEPSSFLPRRLYKSTNPKSVEELIVSQPRSAEHNLGHNFFLSIQTPYREIRNTFLGITFLRIEIER